MTGVWSFVDPVAEQVPLRESSHHQVYCYFICTRVFGVAGAVKTRPCSISAMMGLRVGRCVWWNTYHESLNKSGRMNDMIKWNLSTGKCLLWGYWNLFDMFNWHLSDKPITSVRWMWFFLMSWMSIYTPSLGCVCLSPIHMWTFVWADLQLSGSYLWYSRVIEPLIFTSGPFVCGKDPLAHSAAQNPQSFLTILQQQTHNTRVTWQAKYKNDDLIWHRLPGTHLIRSSKQGRVCSGKFNTDRK